MLRNFIYKLYVKVLSRGNVRFYEPLLGFTAVCTLYSVKAENGNFIRSFTKNVVYTLGRTNVISNN